jgi:hypothetical protein
LGEGEARSALEQLTNRPLAPLLSAWSALSLGRIGLLDGSSSVRLPWLILAGLAPVSVFFALRARAGERLAFAAGAWLLFSPGFVASALSVRPTALAVWSGWLVLVAYTCAHRQRIPRVRCALFAACAVLASAAFGLSFSALWVVLVLVAHGLSARPLAALRASERGYLPIPTATLCVLTALPIAVFTFDPVLWHAEVPALIRRVFDEADPSESIAQRVAPLVMPCLLGLVGLAVLAETALARRFATGEFRPARDPSALGLLLALTLFLALVCLLLGAAPGAEFGVELLRPILACLVALGAAELGARLFSRHARWAELAFLLFSLLVR